MSERSPMPVDKVAPAEPVTQTLPVLPPATALVEMLVLMVLPAVLDLYWPAFPTLSELQPHPFWLPVLLVSLQYGTVSGLLAAGLAIALSASLGWPDQEIGENHFNFLLRIWAQPVLWLAAALVLGQFRMRQIEQKQDLANQVDELATQRKALADYATNLRTRCDALERDIARRRDPSARALLKAMGRLDGSGDGDDVRKHLEDCLDLALGRCRVAVFTRGPESLRMVFRYGPGADGHPAVDQLAAAEPLCQAVAVEGRTLSVLVPADEAALTGKGIAAAPVVSQRTGEIVGMILLETADASELDADIDLRLAVIASRIAPLIDSGARNFGAAPKPAAMLQARPPARPRLWRHVKWVRRSDRNSAAASKSSANFG